MNSDRERLPSSVDLERIKARKRRLWTKVNEIQDRMNCYSPGSKEYAALDALRQKLRAALDKSPGLNESHPFLSEVHAHHEKHSGSLAEAYMRVMRRRPELYQSWIQSSLGPSKPESTASVNFMDEARAYKVAHGCSLSQAIEKVAARRPKLFEAWLDNADIT